MPRHRVLLSTPVTQPQSAVDAVLAEARRAGASYADARVVATESEGIALRLDEVEKLARDESRGLGVRVLAEGAWGSRRRPRSTRRARSPRSGAPSRSRAPPPAPPPRRSPSPRRSRSAAAGRRRS